MSNFDRKSGLVTGEAESGIQDINLTLVTAPTLSVVSVQEALNYLKLPDDTFDGDLVSGLIYGAIGMIERESGGIALCPQVWKQTQQGGCKQIKLLRQPIIGVPTVSYYDDFDDTAAVNITYSSYFKTVQPNILVHTDGYWEEGRDLDGYEITFNCGMFTASTYTSSNDPRLNMFKTAILRTVAYLYENREENVNNVSEGNWKVSYSDGLPPGIKALIMPLHSGEGLI